MALFAIGDTEFIVAVDITPEAFEGMYGLTESFYYRNADKWEHINAPT